jgi:hypothetical protein
MSSYCYDCSKEVPDGVFRCDDCVNKINHPEEFRRRRPLTAQEARKLKWYKNEKVWHEDIKSRKVLPNGDVAIVDQKGRIKEVRPKLQS